MRHGVLAFALLALCVIAAPGGQAFAQEAGWEERWKAAQERWKAHQRAQPDGEKIIAEQEKRAAQREREKAIRAAQQEAAKLKSAAQIEREEAERKQRAEQAEREERERAGRIARIEEAVDLHYRRAVEFVPGLVEPLIDYSAVEPGDSFCAAGAAPRTHAVLVGADDMGAGDRYLLVGPANDIDLVATVLGQLGVDPGRIHILKDDRANRAGVREAFLAVLSDVRCEDRVIVHFSGHAATVQHMTWALWRHLSDAGVYGAELPDQSKIVESIAKEKMTFDDVRRLFVENAFGRDGPSDSVIMLNDDSRDFHEIMLGRDVSEYFVALRNRGAHAVVFFDLEHSAAADLQTRQREAGEAASWSFEYASANRPPKERLGNALVPGHGEYAAFYAAGAGELTPELLLPRGDPDARKYGLFSYFIAEALIASDLATPRSVAAHIQQSYAADNRVRPHPRVESSNPDLVLVAEAASAQGGESPIRILSPTPKRGATAVERPEIAIEGVVEWPSRVLGVHVGTQPAHLDAAGRFSATVPLASGMNTVNVVAVTADSRMHRHVLEFVYEGDRKALEGEGRRYAVIIANQTYGGATGFASLATPFADADALAALLTSKYGFETAIRHANTDVSLVLKDPTKVDIQRALHHVGRVAGEKDTVLVYYAGHGIYEPVTSTAYWVPADAEAGFEPSYLSAADISAAIQRIQAGSVVLISDSCYSGALIRGGEGETETVEDGERLQALLRMQARRSRVVITSGNNEPVEDLGGRGHSVFARALLTGLERMEHDAFSARELFDGYILHAVTANADQEPQYRPLEKVGHEGGDFVFVRMPAATAAAQ